MKTLCLAIMAAAAVSACAINPDARRGLAPNVDLQIYDNPDLHLAAVERQPGTSSQISLRLVFDGAQSGAAENRMLKIGAMYAWPAPGEPGAWTSARMTN